MKNRSVFKNGHLAWNKGIHWSEEHKLKLSKSIKGRKLSKEWKKNISDGVLKYLINNKSPNFGRHHTKETKEKMSKSNRGYQSYITRKKISISHKGIIQSEETKRKYKEWRKNQVIPKKDTSIEIKIQNFLKQLGLEFMTHQYIKEIEHGYQCDILIPYMNLVIECDGNYWHKYPIGNDIDHIRTKELLEKGFKVLRLWENEIKVMELNEFKEKINGV